MDEPARRLQAWLPHVLLLALAVALVALVLVVIWPLAESLLLAGAIALLTYPIVFLPLVRLVGRLRPNWDGPTRSLVGAVIATLVVGGVACGAVLTAVWVVCGSWERLTDLVWGVVFNDHERLQRAVDVLTESVMQVLRLYPQLPWEEAEIRAGIAGWLGHGPLSTDMLGYLFRGSIGVMAQSALTLIALFYLYAQGAQLVERVLDWLPLSQHERADLIERIVGITSFVAISILPRALVQGAMCGAISWLIADAHPLATGAVASFLALLPLVGPNIAWFPYASVLWSQGQPWTAVCLGVACMSAAWAIELALQRLAPRWRADSVWLSFLLFCGLTGGIIGFGLRGVIIGPAAAVAAVAFLGFLHAVYGPRSERDVQ